jgi:hypothetical protein
MLLPKGATGRHAMNQAQGRQAIDRLKAATLTVLPPISIDGTGRFYQGYY